MIFHHTLVRCPTFANTQFHGDFVTYEYHNGSLIINIIGNQEKI